MEKLYVETVFTTSGIPTYTYVEPSEYSELLVAVRTPGKCIVIEGPSGIGKTTAVIKVLDQLGLSQSTSIYSARKSSDRQAIIDISNRKHSKAALEIMLLFLYGLWMLMKPCLMNPNNMVVLLLTQMVLMKSKLKKL